MAKPTYNDKRRYKYAIILNATGNAKLAAKDRQLSDANFIAKYGFDVRKTERQPKGARKSTQYIYNKYLRLRDLGYKPEVAKKLKYEPISRNIGGISKVFLSIPLKAPAPKHKEARKEKWAYWARGEVDSNNKWHSLMPKWVEKIAESINESTKLPDGTKLDATDKYGYAVLFYAYIENKPIDEIIDQFNFLDRHDGDLYKYQKKIG